MGKREEKEVWWRKKPKVMSLFRRCSPAVRELRWRQASSAHDADRIDFLEKSNEALRGYILELEEAVAILRGDLNDEV
jgi:hypothetical protein